MKIHTVVALEATAGVGRSPFVLLGWFPSYSAFAYIFPVRLSVRGDTYAHRGRRIKTKNERGASLSSFGQPSRVSTDGHGSLAGYNCDVYPFGETQLKKDSRWAFHFIQKHRTYLSLYYLYI